MVAIWKSVSPFWTEWVLNCSLVARFFSEPALARTEDVLGIFEMGSPNEPLSDGVIFAAPGMMMSVLPSLRTMSWPPLLSTTLRSVLSSSGVGFRAAPWAMVVGGACPVVCGVGDGPAASGPAGAGVWA